MAEHAAGVMDIRGAKFDVYVDDAGLWLAYYKGYAVRVESRDKLRAELTKMVKTDAASVQVPFLARPNQYMGAKTTDIASGVATGVHAANGNVLVTWDGTGQKQQVSYGFLFLDGDADSAEWADLLGAREAAQKALDGYEQEHKIDLAQKVREAIGEATHADE